MKNLPLLCAILIIGLFSTNSFAQDTDYISEYLERLENSKKYTLLVAQMLPEDKYDFKVSEASLSFAQNLLHIGFAMDWHSQSLLGGREARQWQTDTIFKRANKSKKEMIALVEATFNEAIELIRNYDVKKLSERLDYFGLSRTKRQILMLLADHITHHRGQMLVMLRLNDIVPPRYVLYQ